MIGINAKFSPYRMVLNRREPVQLKVELTNKDSEAKKASLELKIGARLSLDRIGYKTSDIKRIELMKPGETKTFYFDIWPKNAASATEEPVLVRVTEHEGSFSTAKDEFREDLTLRIE